MIASVRFGTTLLVGYLVCSQAGCITLSSLLGQKQSPALDTSLLEAQGYAIPPGGFPSRVSPDLAKSGPQVVLEIRGLEKKGPHLETIPLSVDRPVFIEEIVRQAALHEKLGPLFIYIMRPSHTGPDVKLETKTDSDGKAESIGQNYALMPGDHIIIIEDKQTALEKFLRSQFSNG